MRFKLWSFVKCGVPLHCLDSHVYPDRNDSTCLDAIYTLNRIVCKLLILDTIGLAVRVFANVPGDLGSIPGRVIPKTQKMVLDVSLSIIRYELRVKWSKPRKGVAPFPTPVVTIEKGAIGSPSTIVANFTYFTINVCKIVDSLISSYPRRVGMPLKAINN